MVVLDGESLTVDDVVEVSRNYESVSVPNRAVERMRASRSLVERMGEEGRVAYGLNTGIGKLASVRIAEEDLLKLQINIVRSHSAGVGDPLPEDIVRAMMVIRANGLVKGHSGIRPKVVDLLCEMLKRRVHPVIPRKGSVGASGDLAPLAHMSLVLAGEGEATYGGHVFSGDEALRRAGLEPLQLHAKEGLALINGTSLMAAYGCLALEDGYRLVKDAIIAASMSLEALKGSTQPLDPRVHALRPHAGQERVAMLVRSLLKESEILATDSSQRVQDAYTLRCIPQVIGACLDVLHNAERVLRVEINSATDNPLLFPEEGDSISCGNFHGQPLAFVLDFMAIALSILGAFSERRIAYLLDGHLSGLPAFLTEESGINSGLMLAQYTAAALASENKVLAHPASADSIPTSANQEDFVCMGPAAGEKLFQVLRNVISIVAIEYLCAAQGLEFLRPAKPGKGCRAALKVLRRAVPKLVDDRPLSPDISAVKNLMQRGDIIGAVESSVGTLNIRP